jgi:hypothetical protein
MKNTNLLPTIVAGLTLLCLWLPAKAQHPCQDEVTQNSLWSLPNLYAEFPDEDPPELYSLPIPPNAIPDVDYMGQQATNAHNAIHDQNGELLFFVVDDRIFNHEGYGLGQFFGDGFEDLNAWQIKGNAEVCVVPDPGNCSRYYMFTSTRGSSANTAFYGLLDISVPNTYHPNQELTGNLVNATNSQGPFASLLASLDFWNTGENPPYAELTDVDFHFATTPLRADNSRVVFVYASGLGYLYKIRVDENGISPIGVDILSINYPSHPGRMELEVYSRADDTYILGVGERNGIFICELDNNLNLISGSDIFFNMVSSEYNEVPFIKGLEFTQNGQYLFFTHHPVSNSPNAVKYIDLTVNQLNDLILPNGGEDFKYSQIELGNDGKLYFAWQGGLAALSDPESPSAFNFDNTAIPVPNYPLSDAGFPAEEPMKVYLLPDQIDGMNYYSHFNIDLECCLAHPIYDAVEYIATETATWSPGNNPFHQDPDCDVVLINELLLIPAGVHITIEDMRFEFFRNARTVIEPGGRLTLDNTTFTSGPCEGMMWLGIEVRGNPALTQLPTANQGFLMATNNSLIEHAYIGAITGERTDNEDQWGNPFILPPPGSEGGIIRCFHSRFRNNQRDIVIQNYYSGTQQGSFNNYCTFENCDFLTVSKLNIPTINPRERVRLVNLADKTVRFWNCSFRNTASFEDLAIENRGIGVSAFQCSVQIRGDNESFQPGLHDNLPPIENVHQTFYQLRIGAWIGSTNGAQIHKMQFQNNQRAVIVQNTRQSIFTLNNLFIPDVSQNYPFQTYGAYFLLSSAFTIEENQFIGAGGGNSTYGLCIENSNILNSENEVYRNLLKDLRVGLLVKGNNRALLPSAVVGLQARCNVFAGNVRADILLNSLSDWRDDQGGISDVNLLTNNLFSDIPGCAIPYRDLMVPINYGQNQPDQPSIYYYSFNNPFTRPVLDNLHPNCPQLKLNVIDNLTITEGVNFSHSEHCPSNFTPDGGPIRSDIEAMFGDLGMINADIENAASVLEAVIDGGETEDVVELLQNVFNEESAYLRDLLMARYPLSREALMAAIEAASSFDPWHLTQVLVANSRLPGDVYLFLKDHDVLSPFFMQFVDDAQQSSGANLARLLTAEVSTKQYQASALHREIIQHLFLHSDSVNNDLVADFNEIVGNEMVNLVAFENYLFSNNLNLASQFIDSLSILAPGMRNWYNTYINFLNVDSLSGADFSPIWDYMHNDSLAKSMSWALLYNYGQTDSLPWIYEDDGPKSLGTARPIEVDQPERFLQAWPNPAKDRVVLTYPREANGMGIVQLFNADGRLVHEFNASDAGFQEINVTGWSPGLYIAKLIVNGKDFETVKISVVR